MTGNLLHQYLIFDLRFPYPRKSPAEAFESKKEKRQLYPGFDHLAIVDRAWSKISVFEQKILEKIGEQEVIEKGEERNCRWRNGYLKPEKQSMQLTHHHNQ